MSKFSLRGFTSLLLSISFLLVLTSGLVLWLAHSPQTFGIGKGAWKHAHIFVSLLMASAAILHLVLNWSVFWGYLWQRTPGRLNLKRELALAVVVVVVIVSAASLGGHGDMMQRLGAMSLQQVAEMSGQPVGQIVSALKKEGIHVDDPADSLTKIAQHNEVPPQKVCAIVQRQMPGRGGPPPARD
jgi:hypothetical protein